MEKILDSLSGLPKSVTDNLPDRWEIAGSTATIKMPEAEGFYLNEIGKAYAEALDVSVVLADVSGISGQLREPKPVVLYGSPGESSKVENGVIYNFDPSKVMFSSGNINERRRMEELDCVGETVVDMFAGIGYFTLPLAKFANPRRVFSCELNPESYRFLRKNIDANGVSERVIPILGDNLALPGKRFADRILMGYIQKTAEHLPKAAEMAKEGCVIHYHDTFPNGKEESCLREAFDRVYGNDGYEVLRLDAVKSYAPGVSHFVGDVRVGRIRHC